MRASGQPIRSANSFGLSRISSLRAIIWGLLFKICYSGSVAFALIAEHGPDEWLPTALRVPFFVGMFSCALMGVALALLAFAPRYTQTALTLTALWPIALVFSVVSMRPLAHKRQAENRPKRET